MYTERAVRRTYGARNERAARTMATFIISLCAILMLTTVSGLICRKAQLPEVIGQILVGILVGPSLLGVMHMSDSLSLFSDLGIIILMFLGGVGCDLQLLKKYSKAAVIIACMGVESGRVELRGGRVFRRHRGKQQRLRGGRGPVYRAGWRHVVRAGVLRGHRPADHRRG